MDKLDNLLWAAARVVVMHDAGSLDEDDIEALRDAVEGVNQAAMPHLESCPGCETCRPATEGGAA